MDWADNISAILAYRIDPEDRMEKIAAALRAAKEEGIKDRAEMLEAIRELRKALRGQITMRDFKQPIKLDEALCWRENDLLANKWADRAFEISKKWSAPNE